MCRGTYNQYNHYSHFLWTYFFNRKLKNLKYKMLKIILVLLQKKNLIYEWCEATKVQTAISNLLEPYKASRPLGSSGDVYSVLQVKNWERWSVSFLNTFGLLKLKPSYPETEWCYIDTHASQDHVWTTHTRHVYCLHRYSTLRTECIACFRCVLAWTQWFMDSVTPTQRIMFKSKKDRSSLN